MKLLLFHPGVALVDCEDCRKYIYDLETGKRSTYKAGPKREERPQVRPPGTPMQCKDCPKGNPTESSKHELTRKNMKAFRFSKRVRASRGMGLAENMRGDQIILRNLTIVDGLMAQAEQQQLGKEIAFNVAGLLVGK